VTFRSALYRGELVHARHDEHARVFRYPVYMASIDPAELPALDRELRLFSLGRRNLFALDPRDYTTALAQPAPSRIVTNLRTLGYLFNPVSLFIAYDAARPRALIAEVNNTYGGRRCYAMAEPHRLADRGARVGFGHDRDFFVSPFLHGALRYEFWLDAALDAERFAIEMLVTARANGRRVLTARFAGARAALSDRTLAAAALRYPAMTAQVIGLIHWQALKLHLRGARYLRPGPDHRPHEAIRERG